MRQVFTSWSGGKDSCFACYRAITDGLKVRYLLNMVAEDGKRSWFHGLSRELLEIQSQALGIPLFQKRSTMSTYESDFKDAIGELKTKGVSGGVFGDVDLTEHLGWVERICQQVNITPYLPLWGLSQEKILEDFISLGFEAMIIVARADIFSDEWLGRKVDMDLIKHLRKLGIHPCGEAGEYHTFVVDGPLFRQRIEVIETSRVLRDGYWLLDISRSELRDKPAKYPRR